MSLAKMTLIGLYNYDNTLFDNLNFDGINKETLVNNILLNGGEFEVLYPDVNMIKFMMNHFSNKWKRTVEKWNNALSLEYNPIENYDRYENYSGNETRTNTGNETVINGGSSVLTRGGNDNSVSENKTSAYDSSTYQPDSYNDTIVNYNSSDSSSVNNTEKRSPNLKEIRTPNLQNHIHGNIGVTTSQQMLKSELDLQEWNLYEHITDLFINEFCIQVY